MISKNIKAFQTAYLILALILFVIFSCSNRNHQYLDEPDKLLVQGANSVKKGNIKEGIKYFDKALKIDPKFHVAYYHRGMAYSKIKEYKKAISDFDMCINIDPNFHVAYLNLAHLWSDQGELEKGISYFSKVLEFDPNYSEAYAARASNKYLLGQIDSAVDDINTCIKLNPEDPVSYLYKAKFLEVKGDCKAVVENYEKAMRLNPDEFSTTIDIVRIRAACPDSKNRDSKKLLNTALKSLDSASDVTHFEYRAVAAAYAENGDFKNAIIYQNKAIQDIQNFDPPTVQSKMYNDIQLKRYLQQLDSYKKNKPWYFKKSN